MTTVGKAWVSRGAGRVQIGGEAWRRGRWARGGGGGGLDGMERDGVIWDRTGVDGAEWYEM